MVYVITKYELNPNAKSNDDIKTDRYLRSLELSKFGFPNKSWTNKLEDAIKFQNQEQPKLVLSMLKVNTPYALKIEEINAVPFYFEQIEDIENGKALLLFNNGESKWLEARIVCKDRCGVHNYAGMEVPLLVLTKEKDGKETIWETTKNGKIYMPRKGNIQALYVRYLKK